MSSKDSLCTVWKWFLAKRVNDWKPLTIFAKGGSIPHVFQTRF